MGLDLQYRGDVGRINYVYLAHRLDPPVTISIDPVCSATDHRTGHVNAAKKIDGIEGIAKDDLIVWVSSAPSDEKARTVAVQPYASTATCAKIKAAGIGAMSRSLSIAPCLSGGLEVTDGGTRVILKEVSFFDGPVTLLATKVPKKESDKAGKGTGRLRSLEQLTIRALTEGCAAIRDKAIGSGVYVCIDNIYVATDDNPCKTATDYMDLFGCQLVGIDKHRVSFRDQCTCDSDAQDCSAQNCQANATSIDWYVDKCALKGIHGLYDWSGVYDEGKGRAVTGFGAAGRETENENEKHIVIPGREFMGSTGAEPKSGDPWLPDFDVIKESDATEEAGFKGKVDKPTSVLHIYPRFPVKQICKSTTSQFEGCVGIPPLGDHPACPCGSDHPTDTTCTCEDVTPRFFNCVGGDFPGRPCTRPAHCEGGYCGQPLCHKRDHAVWTGRVDPDAVRPCWIDQECPSGQQCGFSLFDFSHKDMDSKRFVTLDHIVKANGKLRRGVCDNDGSSCSKNKQCSSGGKCIGYRLRAGKTSL
jgi:hypothetical protein